jgi:hypothetical protein
MKYTKGRAVAQAVSRWLPTAAARVRVRAACGVCGGQSGNGAGFIRVLHFPLPIIIPPNLLGAGTIGLLVGAVPSGPDWTQSPTIPIIKHMHTRSPCLMLLQIYSQVKFPDAEPFHVTVLLIGPVSVAVCRILERITPIHSVMRIGM